MEGYNEDYLNGLIAKAKKSWEGVAVDNYMKNLRDMDAIKRFCGNRQNRVGGIDMKSIEERAHLAALQIFEEIGLSRHSVDRVSEIIAEKIIEQKAIDVDKACDWLDTYLMEIGYPDDWLRDSPNMESGRKRFRKAMEE